METSVSHAWISGCAGCAVVVTSEDAYLLEAGTSEPPRLCSPGQLNNLRILAPDLARSTAGSYPFSETRQELELAWRSQSALTMLLTALDVEHSSSLRSEAAGVAERLLVDNPEVHKRVRWRLLGTPLPREANLDSVQSHETVRELVGEALRMSRWIARAAEIWDQLSFESPVQPDLLTHLRHLCTLYGGFADYALSYGQVKSHAWLTRVPSEERGLLKPATLEFLDRWWSAAVLTRDVLAETFGDSRDSSQRVYQAKKGMEVSNSTGRNAGYTVRGVEAGELSKLGKKRTRRRIAARKGKLRTKTYEKVSPPPGLCWRVEFHDKAGTLIASADVRDPEGSIILVQERDGSYRVSLPVRRLHLRRFSAQRQKLRAEKQQER